MKPLITSETPRVGRPLSFDPGVALEIAMHLFWERGYEGTSVADLTRAMNISPPSLYAAFGDKRRLFKAAVHRYLGGADAVTQSLAAAPTAYDAARSLLMSAAIGDTGGDTPPGCLLASSIVTCTPGAADVREELAEIRRAIEGALRLRIARDIVERQLPPTTDADALASHVFAVVQGMSTLAKDGAGREKLLRIVDVAMRSWPPKA